MSIAVDVMLIIIFALEILLGWKKGLTGVLLGIARIAVSFGVAILLGPSIGGAIGEGGALSRVLGYIVVFIITYAVSTVVILLLKSVKIPLLDRLDKILGLLIGAVLGILTVSLICVPLQSLLSAITRISGNNGFIDVYNNSHVFKFVNESNIFGFIRDVLK